MNKKKYLLPVILLIMGLAFSYCDSGDDGGSGGGAGADFDATLYYTKADLDGGALNTLYYTETETDSLLGDKTDNTDFIDSIKILTGGSGSSVLSNIGWANRDTTGWTPPTDATQVLVKITVCQDQADSGDIVVGFGTTESGSQVSIAAPLSGYDGQTGTTIIGCIDLSIIGAATDPPTTFYPYLIQCDRNYSGSTPYVLVNPLLWIK